MSANPIAMEQLQQILQLKKSGYSLKAIARRTGIARNTVKKYLSKLEAFAGKSSTAMVLKDKKLAAELYNNDTTILKGERYTKLSEHFIYAEKELAKTGVTRQLLWLEYKEQQPEGYNYSQYCYHLNEFLRHKEVVMHLDHKAGEMMMVDFAGKKLSYTDAHSGEVIECNVFIAVLPHSGLIFCKAVHTQNTYDFTNCINGMLKFYGGVPQTILCDNLKTAVVRPSRYEPVFTDMCSQLSEHYGTTFSATRPYHPRDKAMAERCVNIVYIHVYAPLRNHVFTSIEQLNHHINEQLQQFNSKPYKGSSYSRNQLFDEREKSLLQLMPAEPFMLKKCVMATVQRNYHVQLSEDHHYYSVPYTYAGKKVKVLYDNKCVEIYYDHNRIALHVRSSISKAYHTIPEHMPSNHQYAMNIKGWTKPDLLARAAEIGTHTAKAAEHILTSGIYPEQNYKSCHGLLMLQNTFGRERLEAACARALNGTRINYTMIKNILNNGLDKHLSLFDNTSSAAHLPQHDNIRGADSYQ